MGDRWVDSSSVACLSCVNHAFNGFRAEVRGVNLASLDRSPHDTLPFRTSTRIIRRVTKEKDILQAILPRGRRGQAVNGVADQASEQGWSQQSRVSWSEVASRCGVDIPLGLVLPDCVWVTRALKKRLTGCQRVRYAQNKQKGDSLPYGGGFVAVGSPVGPSEGLFGVKGILLGPDSGSNTPELGRPPHK